MAKLTVAEKLTILADAARNTTPPAPRQAARKRIPAAARASARSRARASALLRARWSLHLAAENPDDEFLHVRLRLCVNRVSSNVPRARFTVEEIVALTLDFYKRNYIEGLFLSSGIIGSPNHTMETLARVARSLREDHDFRGYIHLENHSRCRSRP